MFEYLGISAASFFKGISENGQACGIQFARRQGTLFVGGAGKGSDGWSAPGGVDSNGAEGVAKNVTKESA
jgi:hypothetical protein